MFRNGARTAGAVPAGAMMEYAANVAPSGWLLCDGSPVSRTVFAGLFSAIGTGYGVGDGATTFNVPDMRGRVPVGKGTNASVSALNVNDGQAVANRRPHHRTTKTGGASLSGSNSSLSLAGSNSSLSLAGSNSSLTLSGISAFSSVPGSGGTGTAGGDRALVEGAGLGGSQSSLTLSGSNSSLSLSGSNSSLSLSDNTAVGTGVATDALDTPSFVVVQYIIKT